MPEWVTIFNTEYREAFPHIPEATSWRDTVNFYFPFGHKGTHPYELTSRVVQFRTQVESDYATLVPFPPVYDRPSNISDWYDDDPLKPLALAAIETLTDFKTPVCVRDQAINAFGTVDSGRAIRTVAESAGYPSGALGNVAPKEFSELHGLILKLGKGNVKRGIKKIMSLASTA